MSKKTLKKASVIQTVPASFCHHFRHFFRHFVKKTVIFFQIPDQA
jgi:hypothetical protein